MMAYRSSLDVACVVLIVIALAVLVFLWMDLHREFARIDRRIDVDRFRMRSMLRRVNRMATLVTEETRKIEQWEHERTERITLEVNS